MKVRLPQLWAVLYAPPNVDGERKACGNCQHASADVTECAIVLAPITAQMVCGYHVEKGQKVPRDLAGLETVPGGTSCDTCEFYDPVTDAVGRCAAVEGPNLRMAPVQPKGCCARWQEK